MANYPCYSFLSAALIGIGKQIVTRVIQGNTQKVAALQKTDDPFTEILP